MGLRKESLKDLARYFKLHSIIAKASKEIFDKIMTLLDGTFDGMDMKGKIRGSFHDDKLCTQKCDTKTKTAMYSVFVTMDKNMLESAL